MKPVILDEFIAQRARGSYISSIRRADGSYASLQAAQLVLPSFAQARALNRAIALRKFDKPQGLSFVPLDLNSLYLVYFSTEVLQQMKTYNHNSALMSPALITIKMST